MPIAMLLRILTTTAIALPLLSMAQFGLPRSIETTGQSALRNTAIVDLDNDGDLDILVEAFETGWYQNLGQGVFEPFEVIKTDASYGSSASSITGGDVDGDGLNDIVLERISNYMYVLSWYRNVGNGQFDPPIDIAGTFSVDKIIVKDITSDGRADILLLESDFNTGIRWFRNEVTGWVLDTIQPSVYFRSFDVVDLGSDGTMDVLAVGMISSANRAVVVHNDGFGTFTLQQTIPLNGLGNMNGFSHFTDLDGNGTTDILLSYEYFDRVSVMRTNAAGALQAAEDLPFYIDSPWALNSGDLDGDGQMDVLVIANNQKAVAWCRNAGSTYDPAVFLNDQRLTPADVTVADLDQDGDPDLLVRYLERLTWIELDNGAVVTEHLLGNRLKAVLNLVADDVDDDGDNDVIVSSWQGLDWFRNASGVFGERINLITSESYVTQRVELADMDGDGDNDLVCGVGGDLLLLRKIGIASYAEPDTLGTSGNGISHALGDMDQDGDVDVVFLKRGDLDTYLLRNDGNGSFAPAELLYNSLISVTSEVIKVADLNSDGFLDFAFGYSDNSNGNDYLKYFLNLGGGTFSPSNNTGGGSDFWFADIDEDGDEDLLVYISINNNTIRRYNNGSGSFSSVGAIPGADQMTNIGDVNGDGHLDLTTVTRALLGVGNGTFVLGDPLGYGSSASSVSHLADLDGNGLPDLILGSGAQFPIRWQRNLYNTLYHISGQLFADMDGDAAQDPDEPFLPDLPVAFSPYPGSVYTSASGYFSASVDSGSYTISPTAFPPYWGATAGSAVTNVELTEMEPTSENNLLGLVPLVDATSIQPSVTFTATGPCGTPSTFWLSAVNQGTRIEQGTVQFEIDPAFTFLSSTPAPLSVTGNVYSWAFDSLSYFGHIAVAVNVIRPLEVGELVSVVQVSTVDGGGSPTGVFTDSLQMQNLCSFDPNDKQVFPTGYGPAGAVPIDTENLEYVVRFQNTGSAPAQDILIEDLLPAAVDLQRVAVLGYSHGPDLVRVETDGHLSMRFNNIMLPDSGTDALGSQGYVRFRLGLLPGLPHATVIRNTAAIHFDLNSPVITNTTRTTLVDCALWQPTISDLGGILLETNTGDAYQWYLNEEELVGDTDRTYITNGSGSYTAKVTSSYGCVATSEPFMMISTAMDQFDEQAYFLAPNPFSMTAQLITRKALSTDHSVEIIDLNGRSLRTTRGTSGHVLKVDRQGLASGLYILRISLSGNPVGYLRMVIE